LPSWTTDSVLFARLPPGFEPYRRRVTKHGHLDLIVAFDGVECNRRLLPRAAGEPKRLDPYPDTRRWHVLSSENCREQHLKCKYKAVSGWWYQPADIRGLGDRVTPTCGRCGLAGRHCRRAGLKIRVTKSMLMPSQNGENCSREYHIF